MADKCTQNFLFIFVLCAVGAFSGIYAVSNCWFCDSNKNYCLDSSQWTLLTCNSGTLGNDTPCYKVGRTGNRGCATYTGCATSNNVKDYEFTWSQPWVWIWNLIIPTFHDCFSQSHGCHDWFCCRDIDRCNSAPQSPIGVTNPMWHTLSFIAVTLPLVIAAVAMY